MCFFRAITFLIIPVLILNTEGCKKAFVPQRTMSIRTTTATSVEIQNEPPITPHSDLEDDPNTETAGEN